MKKFILFTATALLAFSAIAAMNYVRPTGSVELTAASAVASGDIVQVGESDVVGVAMTSAASGTVYVAYTQGIFEWPQDGTNAVAVGTAMYKAADSAAEVSTTTNSGVAVGIAVGTSPSGNIQVDINR